MLKVVKLFLFFMPKELVMLNLVVKKKTFLPKVIGQAESCCEIFGNLTCRIWIVAAEPQSEIQYSISISKR